MADQNHQPEGVKDGLHKIGEVIEVVQEGDIVEVVDIEIYAKDNKKPPQAHKYKFRIDRVPFTVDHPIITGEKLFELAQKSPAAWRMHQKLHGGRMEEIRVADKVDLSEPGIERFVTMELTQGDGEQARALTETERPIAQTEPEPRRQFRLPEEDELYLGSLGLRWETAIINGTRWLFIHNHPVPVGYRQETATMAIRIEGGYPPGALDMAYFLPHLVRTDGKAIHAATPLPIGGVVFQQWSRHYPWREGIDCLSTHYLRVKGWLDVEPKR